jgi:hypothetical protein
MANQRAVDKLRARFEAAITSSDSNEVLAAFWLHIDLLVKLEIETLPSPSGEHIKEARTLVTKAIARSPLEESVGDQQRQAIVRAAALFEKEGLPELASLLQLFLAVLIDRTEESLEPCHCQFVIKKWQCRACGHTGDYLVWRNINTTLRPEMEQLVASGEFCDGPKCLMCEARLQVTPFFYCNPSREEFIAYWPSDDEAGADKWTQESLKYLENLPLVFRGEKTDFCVIRGTPVALFAELHVGAVTVIQDKDQFVSVASEPVYFFVEPQDMRDMRAYFKGKGAVQTEDWKSAAEAFATSFILNQAGVSRLDMLAASLKNLGRNDEAKSIEEDAIRLQDRLVRERIIQRISRPSVPSVGNFSGHFRILNEGLPASWGFSPLVDLATRISAGK